MQLHLVRHGPPAIDPASAAVSWPLADDAAGDVDMLRTSGVLARGAAWFSSPEPKALGTTALLGESNPTVLEDLREAERPADWLGEEEFIASVRRSLECPDVAARPGWEPLAQVRRRVTTAARAALAARPAGSPGVPAVVLVGHGTAWTLLVSELTGAAADAAAWRQLLLPDHCCLEVHADGAGTITSGWGAWVTPQG